MNESFVHHTQFEVPKGGMGGATLTPRRRNSVTFPLHMLSEYINLAEMA